jgi:hypothetical protein
MTAQWSTVDQPIALQGNTTGKTTDGKTAYFMGSFGVSNASGTMVATGTYVTAIEKINGEWLCTLDFWYWDGPNPW